MLVIMGVLWSAHKGAEFGWSDVAFVILFSAVMALLAYIRPKLFD
jgi:hypothetical protein